MPEAKYTVDTLPLDYPIPTPGGIDFPDDQKFNDPVWLLHESYHYVAAKLEDYAFCREHTNRDEFGHYLAIPIPFPLHLHSNAIERFEEELRKSNWDAKMVGTDVPRWDYVKTPRIMYHLRPITGVAKSGS